MEQVDKYLQKFNEKVKKVNNILNKYDMLRIGINKENQDEYVSEAIDITNKYIFCIAGEKGGRRPYEDSITQLCSLIQKVMLESFGDYFFTYEINLNPIAKDVYYELEK